MPNYFSTTLYIIGYNSAYGNGKKDYWTTVVSGNTLFSTY